MRIKRTPPPAGAPSGHPVQRKVLHPSNPQKSLLVCLCPPPKPYSPPPRCEVSSSSPSPFRALELYNHIPANPDSALGIAKYENTPPFLPPVSWCAPGTTAEEIRSFMRPAVVRKKQKGMQGNPIDREVSVLAYSAMTRSYERRKRIADEEVAADLVAMELDAEGLPVLKNNDVADDSSELSDPPESSTAASSSTVSLDSRIGGCVRGTPPTPWMEDAEAEPAVRRSVAMEPQSEGGKDWETKKGEVVVKRLQKAERFDTPTTQQETAALCSQHSRGRHGRTNDQDEMVRRELASLPDKRARKPRQLFGEGVDARPQLHIRWKHEQEKQAQYHARPSNNTPVKECTLGKRKRDDSDNGNVS